MNPIKWIMSKAKFPRWLPAAGLNEKGQSIIIITFAFLGLIAMLGIALDVGLVYIERVRLKRTVDAAALAAVTELPTEEEAAVRAMDYLNANGYPLTGVNIYVAGCTKDIHNKYLYQSGSNTYISGTNGNTDMVNLPMESQMAAQITQPNQTYPLVRGDYYPYVIYDTNGDGLYDPAIEGNVPSFYIDTRSFQDRTNPGVSELCDQGKFVGVTGSTGAGSFGGASKLKVSGQVPVRMNFMQFFGFSTVAVADSATAENASTLDVAVVLDTTGSMEFDTICSGCWARCGDTANYEVNNARLLPTSGTCTPTSNADRYKTFPENGRVFQIDYNGATMTSLREGNSSLPRPVDQNGDGDFADTNEDYIMIEAEFYTSNSSSWDPAFRSAGKGYWAPQRNWDAKAYAIDGYGYSGCAGFGSDCRSGAVRHNPFTLLNGPNQFGRFYQLAEAQSQTAPRLEYEFYPTWSSSDTTYIYVRAQGNNSNYGSSPTGQFYWSIANSAGANITTVGTANASSTTGTSVGNAWYYGALLNDWSWVKLSAGGLSPNQTYKLRIYAGQPGLGLDRILITKRDLSTSNLDSGLGGVNATPGSARGLAADKCNPIFGLSVTQVDCTARLDVVTTVNNLDDPLFNAMEPVRGAQKSIRDFVARLDPKLDQAGFSNFANDAVQRSQLECLRAARARQADDPTQVNNYPLASATYGEFDELTCFDEDTALSGTVPISFTNVFKAIEDVYPPSGGTDIADGMRRGLHLMGINTDNDDGTLHANNCAWDKSGSNWRLPRRDGTYLNQPGADSKTNPIISHCSRGQAATGIIVLLTDGEPNDATAGDDSECNVVPAPLPYESFPTTANTADTTRIKNFNCIMYYTNIAADNGILIYTIGLGVGADRDLLNSISDQTNAKAYFVLTSSQLNVIFDQILSNTFVRLLQ